MVRVSKVLVTYKNFTRAPRAIHVLFPLPYEDRCVTSASFQILQPLYVAPLCSNEIPTRVKVARPGALAAGTYESYVASIQTVITRQMKLENLHLLLKVALDDGVKAQ